MARALDQVVMEPSWKQVLTPALLDPRMDQLRSFLAEERQAGHGFLPAAGDIFNAFALTPFDKVKVVVLGQDPYPTPGHAHGLAFSVRPGIRPPASLVNIYKELRDDVGIDLTGGTGCLEPWARQGVLLLNTCLTVSPGAPGSHRGRGWEELVGAAIAAVNDRESPSAFVLWGAHAQRAAAGVDRERHLVLTSAHPSPLSASRGFFGSRPFSRVNEWLAEHNAAPIDWRLDTA